MIIKTPSVSIQYDCRCSSDFISGVARRCLIGVGTRGRCNWRSSRDTGSLGHTFHAFVPRGRGMRLYKIPGVARSGRMVRDEGVVYNTLSDVQSP